MKDPSKLSISQLWSIDNPTGRFNDWGERKWLEIEEAKIEETQRTLAQLKLSGRANDLYWLALLTDSQGLEFVLFSDAQIPAQLDIGFGGILVPCFLPFNPQNPISEDRQAAMSKRGVFVYDGWIPISDWMPEQLEMVVSYLDNMVSVFPVVGRYHAFWEPKYRYSTQPTPTQILLGYDIEALSNTLSILYQLPQQDQMAISRSVAWMSNALKDSGVARFMLIFLSIESLATYIESSNNIDSSILKQTFAGPQLPKEERREERNKCIQAILGEGELTANKIEEAYFNCIRHSIKALLVEHLDRIFGNDSFSSIMFRKKVSDKTLWDLRNTIAHGSTNLLNEDEVRFINFQMATLEGIARSYLRQIFGRLVESDYFPPERRPILGISVAQGVGAPGTTYTGPAEMADYYLNIASISSSNIRIQFGS